MKKNGGSSAIESRVVSNRWGKQGQEEVNKKNGKEDPSLSRRAKKGSKGI